MVSKRRQAGSRIGDRTNGKGIYLPPWVVNCREFITEDLIAATSLPEEDAGEGQAREECPLL